MRCDVITASNNSQRASILNYSPCIVGIAVLSAEVSVDNAHTVANKSTGLLILRVARR